MEKLYNIEDLVSLKISLDKYNRFMNYLRHELGATSDEAIFRYCRQAGIKATTEGKLYREIF